MNLISKFEAGLEILKAKLTDKTIPLAVRIEVTNRCPNRCLYCNIWKYNNIPEPTTDEIFNLLDQLKKLGTKKISFSGGEPMLRKDIGKIVDYAKSIGISAEMNSCGFLVKERINEIKNLDLIKISLDGKKETNDFITKRKGSYEDAISAIEAATKEKIKTVIVATLTKYNLDDVDFLIELAKKYNCFVAFQPAKSMVYSKVDVAELLPEVSEYKGTILKLMEYKRKDGKFMRNNLAGLKKILNLYEDKNFKKCAAGKIFVIIDTDGTVYPCDRVDYEYERPLPNYKTAGLKEALKKLPEVRCSGCGFCGALELSFLFSFRFNVLREVNKLTK